MSTTVSVGGFEVSSNNESSEDMLQALTPKKADSPAPRVIQKDGVAVEQEKDPAAVALGKKGGEAAAQKRAAELKAKPKAPVAAPAEAEEGGEDEAEGEAERPLGKPRHDPRARVQQATQQLKAEREERQRLEERLARIEAAQREVPRQAREAEPQEPRRAPAPDPSRPKVEDFEDYEQFSEALADWKVEQKLNERDQRAQAHAKARQHADGFERVKTTYREKMQAAVKADPEFLNSLSPEVAGLRPSSTIEQGGQLEQTHVIADQIMVSGDPAGLARYLSDSPEEFQRLVSLPSPSAIIREMARIQGRLERDASADDTPPPPVSKARPPLRPVSASSVPVDEDITGEIDLDTFVKRTRGRKR